MNVREPFAEALPAVTVQPIVCRPVVASLLFAACATALLLCASAPVALLAGIGYAAFAEASPLQQALKPASKWLLQGCVVLLGFNMDLPVVLRLGRDGSLFAALTIAATLLLGTWLGRHLTLGRKTTLLVSIGTAICGGSAIAAASTVIAATEAEIAIAIGTVFLLNATALFTFPLLGHALHLTQGQFGLWAGVAIHDISSVVGAGLSYGNDALATATAVKLSRTLWIVPVTLGLAWQACKKTTPRDTQGRKPAITLPWFVGLFLVASCLRSFLPAVAGFAPHLASVAQRGMILVLFLIGTSLTVKAFRSVGWRTLALGLTLWAFVSIGSLAAIRWLHLA